jgi:uncharacterized protein YecE (DUF72 family)
MKEPILLGTRGWEEPAWSPSFYPEELPPEWRFTYYSNQLRAVLVPAERGAVVTETEVREWPEDSDPGFRFVLEAPLTLGRPVPDVPLEVTLARFMRVFEPLGPQTAGVLLRIASDAPPDAAWLDRLLTRVRDRDPRLCVDLPPAFRNPATLAALDRHEAGLCWQTAVEAAPRAGGRLLVALTQTAEPRAQRGLLERLAQWQGERAATAGLFFEGPRAPELAQQARLLAELMMV